MTRLRVQNTIEGGLQSLGYQWKEASCNQEPQQIQFHSEVQENKVSLWISNLAYTKRSWKNVIWSNTALIDNNKEKTRNLSL